MSNRPAIHCHDGEVSPVFKFKSPAWEPFGDGLIRCTYCGSIEPMKLIQLHEAGVKLDMEMADQKYGFPHKIYVRGIPSPTDAENLIPQAKVYITHVNDLDDTELERFSRVLEHHLRLAVWRTPDGDDTKSVMIGSAVMKGSSLPRGGIL